jgi:hypothetical protein
MFASAVGISTAGAVEGDAQTLSPNASLTAQDLAVVATAAPGVGNSVTVTLRDDGVDTALACTISGLGNTCNSAAASATIAAGSRLSFQLTSSGVVPATSLLVGWQVA